MDSHRATGDRIPPSVPTEKPDLTGGGQNINMDVQVASHLRESVRGFRDVGVGLSGKPGRCSTVTRREGALMFERDEGNRGSRGRDVGDGGG
jgi:hypothetical protein